MVSYFEAYDGERLAFHEVGEGRTLVLIHGFFSTARVNWIAYGHARIIADRGYRVVMPDLRGHGESAKPHDPQRYQGDVLADDGLALVEHLGLTGSPDYDLGGYSLGARTTARMLVRGATPGRAVLGGMGLEGITRTGGRGEHFREVLTSTEQFPRYSPQWRSQSFLRKVGGDPIALLRVLESFQDTPAGDLSSITQPTLVVCGEKDQDNGSPQELADALPNGRLTIVPGDHMSAVADKALGRAIADFLGDPDDL